VGGVQPASETGLWSNAVVRPVRLKPKEPDVRPTHKSGSVRGLGAKAPGPTRPAHAAANPTGVC
jgi:hypothetical protein